MTDLHARRCIQFKILAVDASGPLVRRFKFFGRKIPTYRVLVSAQPEGQPLKTAWLCVDDIYNVKYTFTVSGLTDEQIIKLTSEETM